ncbi:hypothetical protein ATEIFO6365_0003053600 [Aspergillus terreus]|uniref:Uncharacterized protein n=1 Tax=Aspergillus terreus TaxID=33178 RepID=A0A5M3YSE4_ASPTE|nr:hypothetical protein ATETN484_0003048100 [Aspergillus terreus]GFF14470.1 hypothetical protein ATEIFO6365_0003053600 [Aspergillus terreus]
MPSVSQPNAAHYNTLLAPAVDFTTLPSVIDFINSKQREIDHSNTPIDEACERRVLPGMRVTYFEAEETLILKLSNRPHETVAEHLNLKIAFACQALGITPMMLSYTGRGRQQLAATGVLKEPDKSYLPGTRGGHDFPSFVVEVGVSEPIAQLRSDACLWLECTDGWTRLVVLVKLRHADRAMRIERWIGARSHPTGSQGQDGVYRAEEMGKAITIGFADINSITVENGPLGLPIALILDNPMSLLPSMDWTTVVCISDQELCELAREVSRML